MKDVKRPYLVVRISYLGEKGKKSVNTKLKLKIKPKEVSGMLYRIICFMCYMSY